MSPAQQWTAANQRHLMNALARVRALVEHGEAVAVEPWADDREPPAFVTLQRIFGLSQFELDVVLLCAGIELRDEFATALRALGGVTFGLALARLPGAHWSALTPNSPLRGWRLVMLGAGDTLTSRALHVDERVLHFLAGVGHTDEQLDGYVELETTNRLLAPSHALVAQQLVATWRRPSAALPIIQLTGNDVAAQRAVALAAAARQGWRLFRLDAGQLPAAPEALHAFSRLWNRESMLANGALLVDATGLDTSDGERMRRVDAVLTAAIGPVIVLRDRMRTLLDRVHVTFAVDRSSRAEQQAAWRESLGSDAIALNGQIDAITAQFSLDTAAIESAALQARSSAVRGETIAQALWGACLGQSRERVSGIARRIDTTAGWQDIVLPESQRVLLREIITHVRRKAMVMDAWGFASKSARGIGISALFAGPSGTGKTMAAEVVARELGLDLLHVDLSRVVSKYIGETEKNLARVFDDAEAGGAILLFDEADALFGKRSEVHDSHDRYANLEVSYLLQRMEEYRGLAILTSNLKKALDDAFQRRLRFVINFPFPGPAARAEIWRRTIPSETPVDGLDFDRLGQLNVAGGTIRTVALHAAFLAADAEQPLRMAHLLTAAQRVYAKRDLPLTDAETRGWT